MVYRIYVEKKPGLDQEARAIENDLRKLLELEGISRVRILNRYDAEGLSDDLFRYAVKTVFSEPQLDNTYGTLEDAGLSVGEDSSAQVLSQTGEEATAVFAVEYLPGQFDQRADSAAQCIQILSQGNRPTVRSAKVYALYGTLTAEELVEIKKYVINPVEAREAAMELPQTLETCRQKGMRIAIVCKYNLPLPPLSPNSSMMADGTVELKTMSLGATAKNVGEMFTQSEINEIKESPTMGSFVATMRNQGKTIILDPGTNTMIARRTYLSNDNMVDASTCQYPDYTWFIKNCPHAAYPSEINDLFLQLFRSPTQYTIRTNEKYPQFVAFDSSTGLISEVSVTNPSEPEKPTSSSSFFKSIADWIIEFCRKIMVFFGMQ